MDAPQPLAELVPDVPADLDAVVMKCLSKSPDGRPASAAELSARLLKFASGEGRAAVARLVRSVEGKFLSQTSTKPPPAGSALRALLAGPQRRVLLGGIVAASIAISAVAFALLGHRGTDAGSATATATSTPTATPTSTSTSTSTATPTPTPTSTPTPTT